MRTQETPVQSKFGPPASAPPDPAWRPWVRLLELVLESADDPAWAAAAAGAAAGASLVRHRPRRLDALALLRAAITHDDAAIGRAAAALGVEAPALGVV